MAAVTEDPSSPRWPRHGCGKTIAHRHDRMSRGLGPVSESRPGADGSTCGSADEPGTVPHDAPKKAHGVCRVGHDPHRSVHEIRLTPRVNRQPRRGAGARRWHET